MARSTLHCSLCSRHWFRESIGRNPILQVYQSDLGLGLPVFVVAVIVNVAVFCCVVNIVISILNRECAESTLVRDFATFHIFFDFSHTPDQVLTPDTPDQAHTLDTPDQAHLRWIFIIAIIIRSPVGNLCTTDESTAICQKVKIVARENSLPRSDTQVVVGPVSPLRAQLPLMQILWKVTRSNTVLTIQ